MLGLTSFTDTGCWCLGRVSCFHTVGAGSRMKLSSEKTPPSPPPPPPLCCFRVFVGVQIPVILPLTTQQVTNIAPSTSHWAMSVMTVKSALKCRCEDHPASSPLIFPIFSHALPHFLFLVSEWCCPQGPKIGKHSS